MYSLCYRYSGCVVAVPPGRMWALAGRERRVEPAGSWKVPSVGGGHQASILLTESCYVELKK